MWRLIGSEKIIIKSGQFHIQTMGWLNEKKRNFPLPTFKSVKKMDSKVGESLKIREKKIAQPTFRLHNKSLFFRFDQDYYEGFTHYDDAAYEEIITAIESFLKHHK